MAKIRKHLSISAALASFLIVVLLITTGSVFASSSLKKPVIEKIAPRDTEARITWDKNKKADGFEIFRDGEPVNVNLTFKDYVTPYYIDKGLVPENTYTYKVRAFTAKKVKQYYNSKTKKWVNSKPAAKYWKGKKTRTVKKKTYSKFSKSMQTTTFVYRSDIDGIRQDILKTFNDTVKEVKNTHDRWDKDLYQSAYMSDELNDYAQRVAEYNNSIERVTSRFGPDTERMNYPCNIVSEKYDCDTESYCAANVTKFTKKGMIDKFIKNNQILRADMYAAEDIAIGIGYKRGYVCLLVAYNTDGFVSDAYPQEWRQPYSRPW